ncbi:MAG: hypothetical protein PHS92_01680 [Candidatus Gracilibacteria bacterium]|nr:hypothetical protein [Candidatus Gracilibacteria bacterium]
MLKKVSLRKLLRRLQTAENKYRNYATTVVLGHENNEICEIVEELDRVSHNILVVMMNSCLEKCGEHLVSAYESLVERLRNYSISMAFA